jgi:hypothetical protein
VTGDHGTSRTYCFSALRTCQLRDGRKQAGPDVWRPLRNIPRRNVWDTTQGPPQFRFRRSPGSRPRVKVYARRATIAQPCLGADAELLSAPPRDLEAGL